MGAMELTAVRLLDQPIIQPGMCRRMGTNINGPSVIRVPEWVENALGAYYLYFAHHRGDYIRLAYADAITGPWSIYQPGVLPLAESGFSHHIASPEVIVDHANRQIRMFFHGGDEIKYQFTRLAISTDGLNFRAGPENLMNPYARLFEYGDWVYAITMPGQFYRSADGLQDFIPGPRLFSADMRHAAVWVEGNWLHVIYSNRGDAPESLLYSGIDLSADWMEWREEISEILLTPERGYEGVDFAIEPSTIGPAEEPVRQLRDPAVFQEDGKMYLIYAVAGENGLALAEIHRHAERAEPVHTPQFHPDRSDQRHRGPKTQGDLRARDLLR